MNDDDDKKEEEEDEFPGCSSTPEPLDKVIFDILCIIFLIVAFGTFLLYLPDILEILFPK